MLCNNIHFTITLLLSFFSIVFWLSLYPFLVQSCSCTIHVLYNSCFYTIHVPIQSMFSTIHVSIPSMFYTIHVPIQSMFYTIHVPIRSMFLYIPCSYTILDPSLQSMLYTIHKPALYNPSSIKKTGSFTIYVPIQSMIHTICVSSNLNFYPIHISIQSIFLSNPSSNSIHISIQSLL